MSTLPDAKTRPSRTINQNPDAMPPLSKAIPLGLQHIMAMFAGNVTPPIIIAGVIGANPAEQIFLIQVALPLAKAFGLPAVLGASFVAGLLQIVLGAFLKKIRHWFSPVVTGIVVLLIGITLMPVGLNYAAGGVGADDFASPSNLLLALFVLSVSRWNTA